MKGYKIPSRMTVGIRKELVKDLDGYVNWYTTRNKYNIVYNNADTLIHELTHLLFFIFTGESQHDKKFYKVKKFLTKELRKK